MCDVKLDKREHDSYKWANYEEALNLLTYDTDKDILKQCISIVNGEGGI